MIKALQNLVLFKLGWIACVFFAAAGQPAASLLSVAAVVCIHLMRVPVPAKEGLLLAAAAAIGLVWESTLVSLGVMIYPGSSPDALIAPLWIVAMWVLFATTVNHGMSWIKRNVLVAALAGLIGGPLAFLGGVKAGAAEFSDTYLALATLGLGWAVLLPLLALIADTIIDSPLLEPRQPSPRRLPLTRLVIPGRRLGNNV